MISVKRENRRFGYIMSIVILLIALYQWYQQKPLFIVFLITGIILLLTAIVYPIILNRPRVIWEWIGHILGEINTRIILTVLYFFIVTPFGFVARICGYDPLKKRRWKEQSSYWQLPEDEQHTSLQNQF